MALAERETVVESVAETVTDIWHNPDLLAEGQVARSAVVGAAIGIVMFVLAVGGLALAVGLDLAPAIGLGVFTAFWGGLGFGGMIGAVRAVNRLEADRQP